MATCNLTTLIDDACANGFVCLDARMSRAVELQLVKNVAGDSNTIGQLILQACDNGFICVASDKRMSLAVENQLYCNITEA